MKLTFELTGFAARTVERVAREENVTPAQALLLILDQATQLVDAGLLLGDEDADVFLPHVDDTAVRQA